jgi:hypothetical protein
MSSMPAKVKAFDRAITTEENGQVKEIDRDTYRAMPLKNRVRLLVEGRVRFYVGDREVPASEALKGL